MAGLQWMLDCGKPRWRKENSFSTSDFCCSWHQEGGCTHLVLKWKKKLPSAHSPGFLSPGLWDLGFCGYWGKFLMERGVRHRQSCPGQRGSEVPEGVGLALGFGSGWALKAGVFSSPGGPMALPFKSSSAGPALKLLSEALSPSALRRFGAQLPVLLLWWELMSHNPHEAQPFTNHCFKHPAIGNCIFDQKSL